MKDLTDWAAVHKVYKQTQSIRKTAMILAASRKKAVCFSLKADADTIYYNENIK